MKIINRKSLISLLLLTIFMFLGSVGFVFAFDLPKAGNLPTKTIPEVITGIFNWLVTIVASVCAIIIVIAGVMWATAGGNEDKQTSARKMIISAVVGLIIIGVAYGLVKALVGLF